MHLIAILIVTALHTSVIDLEAIGMKGDWIRTVVSLKDFFALCSVFVAFGEKPFGLPQISSDRLRGGHNRPMHI
ncbi:hypothetical protein DRQ05_00050 [bacterium]|nr:MAG: hypothetical protein DRQ05_00050 [bacterium]